MPCLFLVTDRVQFNPPTQHKLIELLKRQMNKLSNNTGFNANNKVTTEVTQIS